MKNYGQNVPIDRQSADLGSCMHQLGNSLV